MSGRGLVAGPGVGSLSTRSVGGAGGVRGRRGGGGGGGGGRGRARPRGHRPTRTSCASAPGCRGPGRAPSPDAGRGRSEERRVGKEWRCGGAGEDRRAQRL